MGRLGIRGHPRDSRLVMYHVGLYPGCPCFHRSFSSNFNGRNSNKAVNIRRFYRSSCESIKTSGTSRVQGNYI